jgi:N-acyl-L-homoserine lactone synthetase
MYVLSGASEELPKGLHSKVSTYRHKVFVEQLGWELNTQNGAELDQFDRPDTVYVVAQDDEGQVFGCARLLPTTRPYLLGEVFPQLLNGLPPPNSPDVWELSRFAAMDLNNHTSKQGQFSSPVAIKLLQESIARAASHGAKRLITVSPIGIERLLRRAGFHSHRAGPPMIVDGHPIFACWIELKQSVQPRSS